jgi:peptide/nickel transport system permease protein
VGTILGLISGYLGGWVEAVIMRCVDIMLSFPAILVALVFVVTVGASFWMVVSILALLLWAHFARLVRGKVLSWKERDFVALAKIAGASTVRIIAVHIFPNIFNSVVVLATLQIGWAIVVESALSFLGAGHPPSQRGAIWWPRAEMCWTAPGGYPSFQASPSCWWCCRSTCSATGCATSWTLSCGSSRR